MLLDRRSVLVWQRNVFETPLTSITFTLGSHSLGEPWRFATEEIEADPQCQERHANRVESASECCAAGLLH